MYEVFEHTADLGLRVIAPNMEALLAEAAEAMFAAMLEDVGRVRPQQARRFQLRADSYDDLLHDWLAELLYTFHTERLVFCRFQVTLSDSTTAATPARLQSSTDGDAKTGDLAMEATAWGEPADPARHVIDIELKAVTYHRLKVERTADGWLAEVIIDT